MADQLFCVYKTTLNYIISYLIDFVDLENIMLSELSQSETEKHHMISLICDSNEQTELANKIEIDS